MNLINIQQTLAGLVLSSRSLESFARKSFQILLQEQPVSCSALALFDTKKDIISVPYYAGNSADGGTKALQNVNSPLIKVIASQAALLIESADYLSYCEHPQAVEQIPVLWAGIPLFKAEALFAILIFQAYDDVSAANIRQLYPGFLEFAPVFSPYLVTKIRLETLEGSEEKFRNLIETSVDITFQITKSGYIDFVSSNVETLFGCDAPSLIGKHFKVTTPMTQVSKVIKALKEIKQGKIIRNMSLTQKVGSGTLIPMEVSASPMRREGEITGAQGTMRDVSEHQQAQKEIERLAFFPLANPMPVVEVNFQGIPGYINPAGIKLLDKMQLDMAQVSQILPKMYKQDILEAQGEKSLIPAREVSIVGLHLLWNAFFLENQELLHYYATDITMLKETEHELIAAKELAIKNEQVKTLFLANMSHEIRTPLNSILGFTELVEAEVKGKIDADLKAYFEIIHASGTRLWHTVHEILDISQIETGTFELKIETLDLAKLLKELGQTFRSKAEEKNIDLLMSIPPGEIQIAADEYCASQAFSNLFDNAIKYTNSGYVKINTIQSENQVKVVIKDTGIGMSKEYQEQMFNAFSQESTGYTKHFQGVGLGLALAHRYLQLIHGKIELNSEPDVGSTFTVTLKLTGDPSQARLPALPDNQKVAQQHVPEKSAGEHVKLRVLVVEDDPNSQKLAGFTLKHDFDLFFAESVAEAKEQLEAHDIQLILLDLSLKGDEDGLDLARYLRAEKRWSTTPIIALTAHAFTSDRDRCLAAGCNDFMTKPFRRLELLEAINKLILNG